MSGYTTLRARLIIELITPPRLPQTIHKEGAKTKNLMPGGKVDVAPPESKDNAMSPTIISSQRKRKKRNIYAKDNIQCIYNKWKITPRSRLLNGLDGPKLQAQSR
jgi:hypothetical protein